MFTSETLRPDMQYIYWSDPISWKFECKTYCSYDMNHNFRYLTRSATALHGTCQRMQAFKSKQYSRRKINVRNTKLNNLRWFLRKISRNCRCCEESLDMSVSAFALWPLNCHFSRGAANYLECRAEQLFQVLKKVFLRGDPKGEFICGTSPILFTSNRFLCIHHVYHRPYVTAKW